MSLQVYFSPDGLAESAGLDTPTAVVPLNLTYAPRLRENESNTSVITVEWGGFETNISQSVLYEIQYNLSSLKGDSMSPVKVVSSLCKEIFFRNSSILPAFFV